jgi:hypothetical protein
MYHHLHVKHGVATACQNLEPAVGAVVSAGLALSTISCDTAATGGCFWDVH